MRFDIADRLPEDVESERSFLATVCAPGAGSAAAEAVATLSDDDFVKPQHRAVFRAVRLLHSEGTEVHSLTLKDALDRVGELEKIGGYPTLTEILMGEDVERPQVLADVIIRKARLRKLVHAGAELARAASLEDDAPEALLDAAAAKLADLSAPKRGKGLKLLSDIGSVALECIQEVSEGRRSAGVASGLPSLDRWLSGGFKPGQLIILAARPGIGKTTMAMGWARKCAELNSTSAFFSLEMSSEEVWNRMASNASGIPSETLSGGFMTATQWARLRAAKDELGQIPMLIEDQAEISVPEIRARIDRATSRFGKIGLVVVDYLQLLSSAKGSQAAKQNEAVRVAEMSRQLKLMAKDRGIPVVVLSQLNREVEKRNGARPQLSDLRDSGAIEQDADVVIFLHRKGEGENQTYEACLAKNRNGRTGVINLEADLSTYSFRESERETIAVQRDMWEGAL